MEMEETSQGHSALRLMVIGYRIKQLDSLTAV